MTLLILVVSYVYPVSLSAAEVRVEISKEILAHVRAARQQLVLEQASNKLAVDTGARTATTPQNVVLPILLGPGESIVSAQAAFPIQVLGTADYHGYAITHLGIPRGAAAKVVRGQSIVLNTTTNSRHVARRQRVEAGRALEIRREVQGLVLNPGALGKYNLTVVSAKSKSQQVFAPSEVPSLEGSAVVMLILTRESLREGFEIYAEERTQLGTPTIVRTVEWVRQNYRSGADLQETLRNFIREAYELWGIQSLLLGGDTSVVPVRFVDVDYGQGPKAVPTDLYYACLDGNWNADGDEIWGEGYNALTAQSDMADLYPELIVGRLPVQSNQDILNYRAKLKSYLEPTVSDYQNQVLFLAEVLWPARYIPGGSIFNNGANIAERLIQSVGLQEEGILVKRLYETDNFYPGSLPLTRQNSIDEMNSSHGIVMHIGHGFRYTMSLGDRSLTNLQASSLVNQQRPFFLTMLNCTATAYDFPALAEKFILNPQGGAIGVIGASREAFPDNIQLYQEEWFRRLFQDKSLTAAQALHESRLRFLSRSFEEGAFRWSYFITTYLGDPGLDVWRQSPKAALVSHDSTTTLGRHPIQVDVTANGQPVHGATVCLWKDGDFYQLGKTDFNGSIALMVQAETPGVAEITVCGAGILPYRGTIDVQGVTGPSLRATGVFIVDDSSPGTIGNGNGVLEASEEALVRIEVRNEGNSLAESVSLLLNAADPFLAIVDPAITVPNINAGQPAFSNPFRVRMSEFALDQHQVKVDVVLRAQSWTWEDQIQLGILQVAPEINFLTIRDTSGDGVIAANERYYLDLEFKNYGFGQFDGATATLFSNDPDVTILESSATLGSIAHLGTATATFRLQEADVSQENELIVMLMNSAGRVWTFPLETRRPEPASGLLGDPSAGPDIALLTWQKSPSPDVVGYHILRNAGIYGRWNRANADLITSATYFRDDGLEPNTQYRYVVLAVDGSGNQSTLSDQVELKTNPNQNSGWPRAIAQWSNSAPIAANISGDLKFEVVSGADVLYGWNSSGQELTDGDANPGTPGVLANDGTTFAAGLAAADFDNDGFDEIVACSWDARTVAIYNGDGTLLPGWPQSLATTTHGIWAAPAIADLDLDGSLEVIVLALDGNLYVWHTDGTEFLDGDQDPSTHGIFFSIPGPAVTWSRGAPVVANILTEDATPEIVFGSTNQNIYMLRVDGTIAPGWPRDTGGEVTAAPSIGDIDADGSLDIAVPSRGGQLFVLHGDGTDLVGWPQPLETNWAALTPSVALADLSGGPELELVVGGSSGSTYDGKLYMFNSDGALEPGWPVDLGTASQASPVIGDLDMDGVPEIIFGGEDGFLHGFLLDGSPAAGFPIKLGAELRATPTITDVDRDGDVDLVVSGWDQQVYVFDFAGGYIRSNVPWPTFKGNDRRNGLAGFRLATDVGDADRVPARTHLKMNYPNPFNPMTTIRFDLAGSGKQKVSLRVFDVQGRWVRTLVDELLTPGVHSRVWNGRDHRGSSMASGVYFSRLDTPFATQSQKMILVR